MGACKTAIDELRFDTSDDQVMEVYVLVRAWGDCPHTVQGWYHKTFPARVSALDVLKGDIANGEYLMWPREAPGERRAVPA